MSRLTDHMMSLVTAHYSPVISCSLSLDVVKLKNQRRTYCTTRHRHLPTAISCTTNGKNSTNTVLYVIGLTETDHCPWRIGPMTGAQVDKNARLLWALSAFNLQQISYLTSLLSSCYLSHLLSLHAQSLTQHLFVQSLSLVLL